LLLSLNSLAFLLFGVSDSSARLASALLGSLLVMLPLTLRRQLGRRVCLLAAAILALSPTALFLSRTLNGEVALAVGALLVIAGFFNWTEDGRQRWLFLAAIGLALALTAGPMIFSVLIVFGLIVLIKFPDFKALVSNQMPVVSSQITVTNIQENEAESLSSPLPIETTQQDGQFPSQPPTHSALPPVAGQVPNPQSALRTAGLVFLVSLVLFATAGTFNLSGLSVLSGFLPDWLGRFSWPGHPEAGFNAIFLLTIYEPLLVLAGLAGLAYTILDKDLLKQTLGGWFVGLLILDALMIGRPTSNIVLALVPLAFLAALALAELWQSLQREGSWGNEGLLLAAGLVIAGFSYIGLTGWLTRACGPEDTVCQYAWLQPIAALGLFVIIAIFFGFMTHAGVAARGVALTAAALGLIAAINIGWRLNYGPLMDLAYHPLAGIPPSTELVALTDTLANESAQRTGGEKTALDVTVAGISSPALLWQLRNYDKLTQANSAAEAPLTTAAITPAEAELGSEQPYLGQDFTLDAVWSPVGLAPKDLVNWLVYRRVAGRPEGSHAVLWLRADQN
jgi:hypothetical protein